MSDVMSARAENTYRRHRLTVADYHRMGEAGRERAPEYSWDRVTEMIVDFYHDVRERAMVEAR